MKAATHHQGRRILDSCSARALIKAAREEVISFKRATTPIPKVTAKIGYNRNFRSFGKGGRKVTSGVEVTIE